MFPPINHGFRRRTRHWLILPIALLLCTLVACRTTPPVVVPTSTATVAPTAARTIVPTATSSPTPTIRSTPPTPGVTPTPQIDSASVLARSHVPILCYHHIRPWTASDTPDDRAYIVPPQRFAQQMDFLEQHGYHTISPDQLTAYLTEDAPLPQNPILLSFDDADVSQWTNALPVLTKHHFTATFFIMTVVLDKPNYLSSEQVQALNQMGMTIGAHTWDHHRVDRYSGADWDIQITAPTRQLAELLGHPIKYFAYPFGLWNRAAVEHLQQSGFTAAFQLADKQDADAPLFTIRRAIASGYWSVPQFKRALTDFF